MIEYEVFAILGLDVISDGEITNLKNAADAKNETIGVQQLIEFGFHQILKGASGGQVARFHCRVILATVW